MTDVRPTPQKPKLTFASGGWVIALAIVLTMTIVGWRLVHLARSHGSHALGGGDVASYGFDLGHAIVPAEKIVASGMVRDGLPVLDHPPTISPDAADAITRNSRGKFLVSDDRVIGVSIAGEARAYPIRMMNWHEVANDTVGGVPILVTYNPLCDSAVVFNRRVDGAVIRFGISGLLMNSNLLLYDHPPEPTGDAESDSNEAAPTPFVESLWSQLQMRAITGPAADAGMRLEPLACAVVPWSAWRERYPNSGVLAPDPALSDRYKRSPYVSYYGSDTLKFPVEPLPPKRGHRYKEPIVVVYAGNGARALSFQTIRDRIDKQDIWHTNVGESAVWLRYYDAGPGVMVGPADASTKLTTVYAFYFAWYAMHPDMAIE